MTDKVMPTGGPRQPVKRVAPREGDIPADDTVDDQDATDLDAGDGDAEGTEDAAAAGEGATTDGGDGPVVKKTASGVTSVKKSTKDTKPASKRSSKRVTAKGTVPAASARYTPPSPNYSDMPSPMWVPILMFTLFGLGMVSIFLNYLGYLPGATSNWYLLLGLGFILGGIITATQYR